MTQPVNVQGLGTVNFPDEMKPEDIQAALAKMTDLSHPQTGGNLLGQPDDPANAGRWKAVGDVVAAGARSIPAGLAGIAGGLKGLFTPGADAGNEAESAMDWVNSRPWLNLPASTNPRDAMARAQTNDVLGKIVNAPVAGLEAFHDWGMAHTPLAMAAREGKLTPAQYQAYQDMSAREAPGGTLAANLLGQGATAWLGGRLGAGEDAAAAPAPKPPLPSDEVIAEHPVTQAIDRGYSLPPSEAVRKGASAPAGNVLEGLLGSSAKTRVDAAFKAQEITNHLAMKEIPNIPDGSPLTELTLDKAAEPYNAAYEAVRKIGPIPTDDIFRQGLQNLGRNPGDLSFPKLQGKGVQADIEELKNDYDEPQFTGAAALQQIRDLRANSRSNWHVAENPSGKNQASLENLAYAQRQMADLLEDQVQRHVQLLAQEDMNVDPGLIDNLRNARTQLAKINTLKDAIKPGDENVSAPVLARMLNKGVPLSGSLRDIAEIANNFPRVLVDPMKLGNKSIVNMAELFGGGAGVGLSVAHPLLGAGVLGAALSRPAVRAALLSRTYQKGLRPDIPMSPLDSALLHSSPYLYPAGILSGASNRDLLSGAPPFLPAPALLAGNAGGR